MIAALVVLALAPAAHARSYSMTAPMAETFAIAGGGDVVVAAGHVVWLESRGTREVIVAAGADGVARDLAAFSPRAGERLLSLHGSGTTVLAQRAMCRGRCLDDDDHPGELLRARVQSGDDPAVRRQVRR